ncbi:MAG: hypothetical protein AAF281_17425 [Pseudomonadota bacterium]
MGTSITDWATVEGAYYVGYGGWEWLWFLVSFALCVGSLVLGSRHEKESYKKLKK